MVIQSVCVSSHGLAIADEFVAVAALVFLVVAHRHAEGNEAASQPAAHQAQNETQDPGKGALLLINVCHAGLLAVLASDGNGVIGPVTRGVHRHIGLSNHQDRLHHGLSRSGLHWWLLHHGLLHGLGVGLLGSVLLLTGHGSVARLGLLHKGLLLGQASGYGSAIVDRFAFHLCLFFTIYNTNIFD